MTPLETELTVRLRRARWLAGALLAAMAAVFATSSYLVSDYPAVGVVLAFSEAALIGGLADWFAVTALFRRPLGLPIPHTAIVPSSKDEIGNALALFVGEHFLVREAIEKRLSRTDLAERIGTWLESEHNARLVSRDLGVALDWLLRGADSAALRESVKTGFFDVLERVSMTEALAVLVEVLASGDNAQALIDQLVQFGRDQLESNKATIRKRIEQRSPWWMPKFVDEEIYDQLVAEFERILNEIGSDPEHPARRDFHARLARLRGLLISDTTLIAKGERLRTEFFEHPAVRRYFRDVWEHVRDYLREAFSNPRSALRLGIENEIRRIGSMISKDVAARQRLNQWLREVFVYVVDNYRDQLSEVISDTIKEWDADSTAQRIELHIGKDLQFIRINGTVVGGIIGVAIYFGSRLVGLA